MSRRSRLPFLLLAGLAALLFALWLLVRDQDGDRRGPGARTAASRPGSAAAASAAVAPAAAAPAAPGAAPMLASGGCASGEVAVSGTVSDASGGAIAGARIGEVRPSEARRRISFSVLIALAATRRAQPIAIAPLAVTDDAGRFASCLGPGASELAAAADGYGTDLRAVDAARPRIDFQLVPEATAAGRVVRAEDGAPVAGALVTAALTGVRGRSGAAAVAVAGADGRFEIRGIAPGRLELRAQRDGVAMVGSPLAVTVDSGAAIDDLVIPMAAAIRISGIAVSAGVPQPDVALVWVTEAGGSATAWSGADGRFAMADAPPGRGAFQVAGGAPFAREVLAPAVHVAAAGAPPVTVELAPEYVVRGRVVRDGAPVAGAMVTTHLSGGTGPTGADGSFELAMRHPGSYQLRAAQEELGLASPPRDVELTSPVTDGVVLDLTIAGSVAGSVVDEQGAAVAGALVLLHCTDGAGESRGRGTAGADGRFRIGGLAGGRCEVKVHGTGADSELLPVDPRGFAPIELPGPTSQVGAVRLAVRMAELQVSGVVVDDGGAPRPDTRVTAVGTDLQTTTAVDGSFTLAGLHPGGYTLQVAAPDGSRLRLRRPPIDAETSGLRIVLPAVAIIRGTADGFASAPRIHAAPAPFSLDRFDDRASGSPFELRVPPGRYVVTAQAGSQGDAVSVTVGAGSSTSVVLRARPPARVTGRVLDAASGQPVTSGFDCRALVGADSEGGVLPGGARPGRRRRRLRPRSGPVGRAGHRL